MSVMDAFKSIGPVHQAQLASLKLTTVKDLAEYPYVRLARSIVVLSDVEDDNILEEDGNTPNVTSNIGNGIDKEYITKSFKELVKAPVSAFLGIGPSSEATLEKLGVHTVGDLANWKYQIWAEAVCVAADHEEEAAAIDQQK